MNDAPWRTERPLDEKIVADVVRRQFPVVRAGSVEFLHQGWDSEAYLVDGEWIFRFPKRHAVVEWHDNERKVLARLAELPLPVLVPRPEFLGEPDETFPFPFMGYRSIAGRRADSLDPLTLRRNDCAAQLGAFLDLVHGVDEAECRRLGIRHCHESDDEALAALGPVLDVLRSSLPSDLREACASYLDATVPRPAAPTRLCLTHGDFEPSNILIGDDRTIAAVIDWGDAVLGDPAGDFVGIFAWLGESAARRAMAAYSHPTPAEFWDRVVFRGRWLTLMNFGWAIASGHMDRDFWLPLVRSAFMPRRGGLSIDGPRL